MAELPAAVLTRLRGIALARAETARPQDRERAKRKFEALRRELDYWEVEVACAIMEAAARKGVPRAGVIGAMERTKEIAVALNQSLQEVEREGLPWEEDGFRDISLRIALLFSRADLQLRNAKEHQDEEKIIAFPSLLRIFGCVYRER
jgi:hypothetical protein